MGTEEKLQFIKSIDPEGGDRLSRLLERKSLLLDKNVYGERFTDRQFNLVFDPLLTSAYEKAQISRCSGRRKGPSSGSPAGLTWTRPGCSAI